MSFIHPTAIISPNVQMGEGVKIGPYAIIEDEVKIGAGTEIFAHAVIASGVTVGEKCKIHSGAVIGTEPQDLKFKDEKTFVVIGDHTTIREYATVNRATTHSYYTRIGNHCLLMAYSHVAHDCQIGNNVVIANAVNMGGHVIIDDFAAVGGMTAIHQFVRVGAHSFTGGGLRINKDVPPYILAMGEPLRFGGLNIIGLQRRGFSKETLQMLKKAYKILYRSNLTINEAISEIEKTTSQSPEIDTLLQHLKASERGIIR